MASGELMNENGLSCRSPIARIARLTVIILLGSTLAAPGSARGATAKRYALTPQQARTFEVWSNYLAEGPEVWSSTRAPAFTPKVRATIWQILRTDSAEQQLTNPMINYLLWRQSLNPTRFTVNHPALSPALTQLLNTPLPTINPTPDPSTSAPQGVTPPAPLTPPSGQSVSPQGVNPPAVPEPGSLLLATGMIGWGLWWRRRMQRGVSR